MKTTIIRKFDVKLFLAVLLLFITAVSYSQDSIRYKNGHVYHVKIVYMNGDTLKYQVADNPDVTLTATRAELDGIWMEKPYVPPPPVKTENVPPEKQPPLESLDLKNEVYAGYGLFPFTEVMVENANIFGSMFIVMFTGEKVETKTTGTGTFYLGYNRSLAKWVSVGVLAGYQRIDSDIKWSDGSQKVTIDNVLFMVSTRFNYLRKPWVTGYSGLSAGVMYWNERDVFSDIDNPEQYYSRFKFSMQLTFFGLRVGRQFGGFVEFGLGYTGVINLGLSYQF